jgi:hypothetical protein
LSDSSYNKLLHKIECESANWNTFGLIMNYKNLTLNIEHDANLYPLFLTLLDMIPFIAPLDKLIRDATKEGPITIDFVNQAESPTGGHFSQSGHIRGNQRSIQRSIKVVSEGKTFAQMIETLVFELCNANNPHFILFSQNAIDPSDYDRDSYAYMKESAEYSETHVPSKTILNKIFSDADIIHMFGTVGIQFNRNELLQMTGQTFRSFDDWWSHVNIRQPGEPIPHAEFYRREHDRVAGIPSPVFVEPPRERRPESDRPITHAHRERGRRSQQQREMVIELDIDEADLLAQAEILNSIQSQNVQRRRF